jgi:hypothetical protein
VSRRYEAKRCPSNDPEFRVIGLSDAEHREVQDWLEELDGPCSLSREVVLVARLCKALGGFMGVDEDILPRAFLEATRARKTNAFNAALERTSPTELM